MALLNSVADGADWWNQLQNFPLAYGGAWAKGKTLTFTSEPVINSMKYWMELLTKGGPEGQLRGRHHQAVGVRPDRHEPQRGGRA